MARSRTLSVASARRGCLPRHSRHTAEPLPDEGRGSALRTTVSPGGEDYRGTRSGAAALRRGGASRRPTARETHRRGLGPGALPLQRRAVVIRESFVHAFEYVSDHRGGPPLRGSAPWVIVSRVSVYCESFRNATSCPVRRGQVGYERPMNRRTGAHANVVHASVARPLLCPLARRPQHRALAQRPQHPGGLPLPDECADLLRDCRPIDLRL